MALTFKKAVKHEAKDFLRKEFSRFPLETRFYLLFDKTPGCWIWLGNKDGCGYGFLKSNGRNIKAHRLAYELYNFKRIPEGYVVCHACDNPSCVNPSHLFVGTMKDNCDDRDAKGRGGNHRGVLNGRAKLTPEQVRQIRHIWSTEKITKRALGRRFGVSDLIVYKILNGQLWSHVQ